MHKIKIHTDQLMVSKSSTHVHCLLLRAGQGKLIAKLLLTGKVMDNLANCSRYIHNHIRCVILFYFVNFRILFGLIHQKK